MTKKILFPTDFSTASDAGLEQATALARGMNAKLIILHVEEPPMAYAAGELYYGVPEPNTEALEKLLYKVTPTDPEIPCSHRLLTGDTATEILRTAEQEHVDLIVMGTHGRTGMKRLVMGSVAEQVVRRAKCPVMTTRIPSDVVVKT
jgi:universal stress protein A